MKKSIIAFIVHLFIIGQSFAHHFWIETNLQGVMGQEQEIRVYFGEYTYGVVEIVK